MTIGMTNTQQKSVDRKTAEAFALSWNNLPTGSVYSVSQFEEWFTPLTKVDVTGKYVLELGCGGGSLMVHMLKWKPARLIGVDLGDSVEKAKENCAMFPTEQWQVVQDDMVKYRGEPADLTYCIGVLHHLKDPEAGIQSLFVNTKPGGRFHGWVYAYEGNTIIRYIVDPIRTIASRLPWWITKYVLATPLVVPFYVYAKILQSLQFPRAASFLPLFDYAKWIAPRNFAFFRHVAFDQLVTPQTTYITKKRVQRWLAHELVDPESTYLVFRNGNSWKFGGKRRSV